MSKNCDWCGNYFEANVSYQIYCTSDCRTEATKEKNLIKQREKRIKSRVGKERTCGSCNKPLSIYNDDTYCSTCIGDDKLYRKFIRNLK